MLRLTSLDAAEAVVLADARRLLAFVRQHAAVEPTTVLQAVEALAALRRETYEDLNQIQHEYCIICSARWLLATGVVGPDVLWRWNPRQTGTATEPDLAGDVGGVRKISAEITTSVEPKRKIDERMTATLVKLNAMDGLRFYFVRSDLMRRRAETKVAKNAWTIKVVCLVD